MNDATVYCYPPIGKEEHLERLAILVFDQVSWAAVHVSVQGILDLLEEKVRSKMNGVHASAGQTKGKSFRLFSYRTFSMPDTDTDPVVAGINFITIGPEVALEADISGEQRGDVLLALPKRIVRESNQEILDMAQELAQRLCEGDSIVVDALSDPSRKVE